MLRRHAAEEHIYPCKEPWKPERGSKDSQPTSTGQIVGSTGNRFQCHTPAGRLPGDSEI
jgi:hypothetical protein